jgi:DNA-3-methyladenine glycosylase II
MRKAVLHLKKSDPVLRALVERVGPCRIEHRDPTFDMLVRSIVYQQLSGKVAAVIFGRLLAAVKGELTPRRVLRLPHERMRALGLSNQKATYIRDLAERTKSGEVDFAALPGMSDEQVIETLTRVKGIGVWTAQMFLIFALKRMDVLPVGDLGVRSAIKKEYGLAELPKPGDMEELARPWRPYCSVASWYLWRSLDGPATL